jgi:hypothetical protein
MWGLSPRDPLIFCDLQVFGCLTHGHTSSVSVSWHFFAGRGIDAALTATVLGRMRTTGGGPYPMGLLLQFAGFGPSSRR